MPTIGAGSLLVPARRDVPELLDQGIGTLEDVRDNLHEMARLNHVFGGVASLTRHLYPLIRSTAGAVRVVDVGAGSASVARHVAAWSRRETQSVTVIPLDIAARNLSIAREHVADQTGVHLLHADGFALPFAKNGVDFIISSLLLHHFAPDPLVGLLRELWSRARRGVVLSDLVRGYVPLIAFRAIQPIFARHYLTAHDGYRSIQRAYTPDELRQLALAAGIESAQVHTHFPYRMTLVAVKNV